MREHMENNVTVIPVYGRNVSVAKDEQHIEVCAETRHIVEALSVPWPEDVIMTQFPVYEVVTFDLQSGHTYMELQYENKESIVKQDITKTPGIWEKGVVYRLLRDSVVMRDAMEATFAELFEDGMPFEKHELTLEKFVLMTRFTGFPRKFYDAIPYELGSYQIQEEFREVAKRLHKREDALALFCEADIPKVKSVKRLFFSNAGLLFYIKECEQLWAIIQDVNYYCRLMKYHNIFDVLSMLHQRPIAYEFFRDYSRVKGVSNMLGLLEEDSVRFWDRALDYCTMSDTMKIAEQEIWKKDKSVYDPDDDFALMHIGGRRRMAPFSTPMFEPYEKVKDCSIDGFCFSWLRSKNDYYMAGKILENCLVAWDSNRYPVVVVRYDEKMIAAIEVASYGITQVKGHKNEDAFDIPNFYEAYQKWMEQFSLEEMEGFE